MMQDKRGQVTLFIIIAIVVVAIILLVVFLQGGLPGGKLSDSDVAKVQGYLTSCFEAKTKEGILAIAKQGGYNKLPEASITFLDEKTAYYWKNNQSLVPNVNTVSQELSSWLDEHADECLNMQGYELNATTCKANAQIQENLTAVDFNCPIKITKGLASSQLSSFNVKINAPITNLLDASAKIVDEYKKQPGNLCITCFDSIALANNVTIKAVPITKETYEPEHIWFLITDKNIKFEDKNITWRFVVEM